MLLDLIHFIWTHSNDTRVTLVACCRFAAAQEAAQQRAGRDKAMGQHPPGQPEKRGPSSLFIFSEDNVVRRYTRFIIEWPYPLHTNLITLIHIIVVVAVVFIIIIIILVHFICKWSRLEVKPFSKNRPIKQNMHSSDVSLYRIKIMIPLEEHLLYFMGPFPRNGINYSAFNQSMWESIERNHLNWTTTCLGLGNEITIRTRRTWYCIPDKMKGDSY